MSRRILTGVLVVAAVLITVFHVFYASTLEKERFREKLLTFKILCGERKSQGYDLREAEDLAREAEENFKRGNYKVANELLNSAFESLERASANTTCKNFTLEAKERLSKVKVASLYERVTDGAIINRSIEEVIDLLRETGTDFIFRGFWRWSPCPNKCEQLLSLRAKQRCKFTGYSYEHLKNVISKIKAEIPNVIFCGAIPSQIIHKGVVWNPETEEVIRYPETWKLALDPQKLGINVSKERFQCEFGKTHLWVPRDLDCRFYDPENVTAYFPDLTNPKFQELLLSWAERQIDAGADAIWIDMLFTQSKILAKITKDINHPAVKESYEAACKIVDEIHRYGDAKGRYVYVGSWATAAMYPYPPPNLDFVTSSPSAKEIMEMKLDGEKWDEKLKAVKQKFGDIPVFAFIDWAATTKTPLGVFSQKLSKEEQKVFLEIADSFFTERGVIFIYPVHGGTMGVDAEILSFGKSRVYDSLSPEFQTYETIKELSQRKGGG